MTVKNGLKKSMLFTALYSEEIKKKVSVIGIQSSQCSRFQFEYNGYLIRDKMLSLQTTVTRVVKLIRLNTLKMLFRLSFHPILSIFDLLYIFSLFLFAVTKDESQLLLSYPFSLSIPPSPLTVSPSTEEGYGKSGIITATWP